MFQKILIANRGEIAVRIIRACREMGIKTVAVYSTADEEALHKELADEAICIGGPASKDSYSNITNILSATILSGAEAIHPGFGFLSENPLFVKMCEKCSINFIGPTSEMIENMGDKAKAKELMRDAGVAISPGSDGILENVEEAVKLSKEIGYPVMIKASGGGGGRGMRIAFSEEELVKVYDQAKQEAEVAFKDDRIYLEKFIEEPRHIEVQLLADKYGNVIHLGERDCSIQRRNQKMIEEAPALISDKVRKAIYEDAVKAAKAVGYFSAGTVEFLVDKNGKRYFIEMNTRIQVEHPVTEWVTGVDLIKEQVRIAAGEKLTLTQEDIVIRGHAIECRINAENPDAGFRSSPGQITTLYVPGGNGVRIDSAIYDGYYVPPYYDSMIAKLIVYGKNREEAICKMQRALGEFIIQGIDTNIAYQFKILRTPEYKKGELTTSFIKEVMED
ncbi:acetyl-CoA carboxylase biotin carboxylase subunit [endosymbiont 'TC1' of Trimyema compressum]|uniref:acetyl-CoA carboxylase biotin carboxylase subunit n=1 Tax=endosymbiont 'TC1' of Trimyema compressum TaxID=243899 RepID=UPI0007F15E75|nr:acetyl-CoA carboxylase biotin carboxylase subunit [endosymbiont 'TC1' of Trimyema compressum]AMP21281.1 acetyl-CoA carboxylase biotin carboxylase subunit [endosymbiont 'TC1' of Trimyema compressum]